MRCMMILSCTGLGQASQLPHTRVIGCTTALKHMLLFAYLLQPLLQALLHLVQLILLHATLLHAQMAIPLRSW